MGGARGCLTLLEAESRCLLLLRVIAHAFSLGLIIVCEGNLLDPWAFKSLTSLAIWLTCSSKLLIDVWVVYYNYMDEVAIDFTRFSRKGP